MRRATKIATSVLLSVALFPTAGSAQRMERPRLTIEVFGGLGNYGRFLEQLIDGTPPGFFLTPDIRERELTAENSFAFGGSLGIWPWEKTGVRLAFTWSNTDLEYEDDTGIDSDALDLEDLADLSNKTLSLEVLRYLLAHHRRISPYAVAGVAATWWGLDDEEDRGEIQSNDGDTQFRWGGVGGIGLQIRARDRIGVRLEATTFGLGNPFDGDDSFTTRSGRTAQLSPTNPRLVLPIDEPGSVRFSRYTVALTYSMPRR